VASAEVNPDVGNLKIDLYRFRHRFNIFDVFYQVFGLKCHSFTFDTTGKRSTCLALAPPVDHCFQVFSTGSVHHDPQLQHLDRH
jgi:hypothetical protein